MKATKWFLLAMTGISISGIAHAETITLVADEWCPFNCTPNSALPGYGVEIAEKVFTPLGHTIEYQLLPWDKAIQQSRTGQFNAIIGAFNGDSPDFIFPEESIGLISGSAIFTLKTQPWEYENISSLAQIKIGTILAYDYGERLNLYLRNAQLSGKIETISGHQPLRRNIQKMLVGRIDAVIDAAPVFWYVANQLGIAEKVRFAGQVDEAESAYIAFSPAIDASTVYSKNLSEGIIRLRKSGELKTILDKYGLQDWK